MSPQDLLSVIMKTNSLHLPMLATSTKERHFSPGHAMGIEWKRDGDSH